MLRLGSAALAAVVWILLAAAATYAQQRGVQVADGTPAAKPLGASSGPPSNGSRFVEPHTKLEPPHGTPLHRVFACSKRLLSMASKEEHTPDTIREALRKAVETAFNDQAKAREAAQVAHQLNVTLLTAQQPDLLQRMAACVANHLVAGGAQGSCSHDPDMSPNPPPGTKLLVAAALHDNEPLMPHYILQLLRVVLVPPKTDPRHVYVSIYESGSKDNTSMWEAVLDHVLSAAGIPASIVFDGQLRRKDNDYRISFLAKVRNHALRPLWARDRPDFPHGFPADKVVYINDVYFCAQDITRLLQYKSADLACGIDFQYRHGVARRSMLTGATAGAPNTHQFMKHTGIEGLAGIEGKQHTAGGSMTASMEAGSVTRSQSRKLAAWSDNGAQQMPQRRQWTFYDMWVARDVEGTSFNSHTPFIRHLPSRKRFEAGLPIPVHCCWNGMAVLNAAPFIKHGLRFRAGESVDGEGDVNQCHSSECSIVCEDFERLGYNKFIIDPSVRMVYEQHPVEVHSNFSVPMRKWGDVSKSLEDEGHSGPAGDGSPDPVAKFWDPVKMGAAGSGEGNFVDWKAAGWTDTGGLNWSLLPKICSWMDVTGGRNYTGDFLKYLSSQLQTPAGREHWVTS